MYENFICIKNVKFFTLRVPKAKKLATLELIYTDAAVVANNVAPKQWLNMNRIMLHKSDSKR